jgi:transcriptional regulator with GAF, ATPase, and Fis domain
MAMTLGERMALVARELQDQYDAQATMDSAVRLAVRDITGADAAGISIVRSRRRVHTPAASSDLVVQADRLQYEVGEGPCLDIIWREEFVHSPDLGTDERWPTWGPRVVAETQARSLMSFRLFTAEHTVGALNLYSRSPHAFDADDRADGIAIAAHISVAVATAQEVGDLAAALASRTLLSQTVGIVMAQYDLDADRAFAALSRLASTTKVKLRDLALEVCNDRRMSPERSGPADAPGDVRDR